MLHKMVIVYIKLISVVFNKSLIMWIIVNGVAKQNKDLSSYLRLFSVLLQFAVSVTLVAPVCTLWVGSTGELWEEVE